MPRKGPSTEILDLRACNPKSVRVFARVVCCLYIAHVYVDAFELCIPWRDNIIGRNNRLGISSAGSTETRVGFNKVIYSRRWSVPSFLSVICDRREEEESRVSAEIKVCVLQRETGSRYIGEEAGKRRAALLCAAAEALVPARKRESCFFHSHFCPERLWQSSRCQNGWNTPIRDNANNAIIFNVSIILNVSFKITVSEIPMTIIITSRFKDNRNISLKQRMFQLFWLFRLH